MHLIWAFCLNYEWGEKGNGITHFFKTDKLLFLQ